MICQVVNGHAQIQATDQALEFMGVTDEYEGRILKCKLFKSVKSWLTQIGRRLYCDQ